MTGDGRNMGAEDDGRRKYSPLHDDEWDGGDVGGPVLLLSRALAASCATPCWLIPSPSPSR